MPKFWSHLPGASFALQIEHVSYAYCSERGDGAGRTIPGISLMLVGGQNVVNDYPSPEARNAAFFALCEAMGLTLTRLGAPGDAGSGRGEA